MYRCVRVGQRARLPSGPLTVPCPTCLNTSSFCSVEFIITVQLTNFIIAECWDQLKYTILKCDASHFSIDSNNIFYNGMRSLQGLMM